MVGPHSATGPGDTNRGFGTQRSLHLQDSKCPQAIHLRASGSRVKMGNEDAAMDFNR